MPARDVRVRSEVMRQQMAAEANYRRLMKQVTLLAGVAAQDDAEGVPEPAHLERNKELYAEIEQLERLVAPYIPDLDQRIAEATQVAYAAYHLAVNG